MLRRTGNSRITYVVAAAIGLLFGLFQRYFFWAIYPIDNPITNWLFEEFAREGQTGIFYLSTYAHDFVVHLLLAMGLSIILLRVFGPRQWAHLLIVIAAWHIVMFWDAVWANMGIVFSYWGFWVNLLTTLSVMPIAYVLLEKIQRTRAST